MTPSQYIKSKGFPSLQHVADKAGITRYRLARWHKTEPEVFELIVDGLKWRKLKDMMTPYRGV